MRAVQLYGKENMRINNIFNIRKLDNEEMLSNKNDL